MRMVGRSPVDNFQKIPAVLVGECGIQKVLLGNLFPASLGFGRDSVLSLLPGFDDAFRRFHRLREHPLATLNAGSNVILLVLPAIPGLPGDVLDRLLVPRNLAVKSKSTLERSGHLLLATRGHASKKALAT